ncbi:MAG: ribonuclease domain-containing protein [Mycobacteriales bacterium]
MLRTRRPLLALVLLGVLLGAGYLLSAVRPEPDAGPAARPGSTVATTPASSARTPAPPAHSAASGLAAVAVSALPAEARQTLRLIDRGGPFPYGQDGTVFGNLERILPREPRGWYREYTVPTPGESDRGARRIVAGRDGSRYYTADHYASFAIVDQDR